MACGASVPGVLGGSVVRCVRRGACVARKTTSCARSVDQPSAPGTPNRLERKQAYSMLMRTRVNAASCCPLASGIPLHHSSLLSWKIPAWPWGVGFL